MKNAEYVLYCVDSLLDAAFLFNNVYRGNQLPPKPEGNFFVNLSIIFPAVTIGLKARAVYRAAIGNMKKEINIMSRKYKSAIIKQLQPGNKASVLERCMHICFAITGTIWFTYINMDLSANKHSKNK